MINNFFMFLLLDALSFIHFFLQFPFLTGGMDNLGAQLHFPVVLGSSSKWRLAVVSENMGIEVAQCVKPDVDEKAIRHPDPSTLVLLLAEAKADAVLARLVPHAPFFPLLSSWNM